MLLDFVVNGWFAGVPIALAALGFALIWYTSKEFHFLYGTLLAASGYGVYALVGGGVPLVVAVVLVVLLMGVVGAVLEHHFYRRLGNPLSVLLFSFGLAIVLQNVLQILYGPTDVVLPHEGLAGSSVEILPFADISRQGSDVVALAVLVVVWVAVALLMQRSDFGLGVQAVMTDPEAAQYVGVRPARVRWMSYFLGSSIGAVSGALSMVGQGVRPTTGFDVMLFAFMATFLGGGVLWRVPIWGLAIGVALSLVAWQLPTNFNTFIVFVLMLSYIMLRRRAGSLRAAVSTRWRRPAPERAGSAA